MNAILITGRDALALRERVDALAGSGLRWILDPADHAARDTTIWFCAGQPPADPLSLPKLEWIHSGWAGIETWMNRPEWISDVILSRTVGDFPERIAEYVFGYLLAQTLELPRTLRLMEQRGWERWTPGTLRDRSLLVVGYGAIGAAIGALGRSFGMRVTGIRRTPANRDQAEDVRGLSDLPAALAQADVVVNVLPLTRATESFWNAERFGRMREGSIFVNVSRGATVDERALIEGIRQGRPAHAILDVFREEPLPPGHPFRTEPKIWITPHVAGIGTLEPLALAFAENLKRFEAGRPLANVVDRERGY